MKNPLRIAKRRLRKQDPYSIVGFQLRRQREQSEMTQWQLADYIAKLLETQKLLDAQLPSLTQSRERPFDLDELEMLKAVLQQLLKYCRELRVSVKSAESAWIHAAISELLNIEQQIGAQIESARDKAGLTQDELSQKIGDILQVVDTAGPPGRAGISKVERGERRLDLLEAWAAAIALGVNIEKLLPPKLAELLPNNPDPMLGWHPVYAWRSCRQYRHDQRPGGLITVACDNGVSIPVRVLAGRV